MDFLWAGTSSTLEFPPELSTQGGPGPRAFASYWQDAGGDLFFYGGISPTGISRLAPFIFTYLFTGFRNDVWVLGGLLFIF